MQKLKLKKKKKSHQMDEIIEWIQLNELDFQTEEVSQNKGEKDKGKNI